MAVTSLSLPLRRPLIQAGALHYTRLPHPELWLPALERLRAAGYNTVWVPVPWAYHSPAPGLYDFTGPRDLPRLLAAAAQAGLWVIAAIGPRVGAELDAGGLPLWLAGVAEQPPARAVQEWWERLCPLLGAQPNLLGLVVEPDWVELARPLVPPVSLWPWSPWPATHNTELPWRWLASGPLDGWGGVGFERLRRTLPAEHPRPALVPVLAQGLGYVVDPFVAGCTWGYWGCPEVYTAYGSGAPVAEGGGLTPVYYQARRLALTAETLGPVLLADAPAPEVYVSGPGVELLARSDGVTTVVGVRAGAAGVTGVQLSVPTAAGGLMTVPLTLPPGAVRLLPWRWPLAGGWLWATTLEPLLRLQVAGRHLLVLVNETGGELWLSDDFRPRHAQGAVRALRQATGWAIRFESGRLASFLLDGPAGPLQLLALEPAWAERVWPLDDAWRTTPAFPAAWAPTPSEPERGLLIGPELVVPQPAGGYTAWNSARGFGYRWGPWRGSNPQTWLAPLNWEAPAPLSAPSLSAWETRAAAPEIQPEYDDHLWQPIAPAESLAQEAQRVSGGLVWYRGRFSGPAQAITLTCRHVAELFLNGSRIAVWQTPPEATAPLAELEPLPQQTIPLPPALLRAENVLALLTESLGHAQGPGGLSVPHGLLAARLEGGGRLSWRLRGGLSGEQSVQGFPGFADWRLVPESNASAVCWQRATFTFQPPPAVTVALFLVIERLAGRALIFLNGYLIGRYAETPGPQRRFWLPDGLWQRAEENEVLIAHWPRGGEPGAGRLSLALGTAYRAATVPGHRR